MWENQSLFSNVPKHLFLRKKLKNQKVSIYHAHFIWFFVFFSFFDETLNFENKVLFSFFFWFQQYPNRLYSSNNEVREKVESLSA